jgi:hypothetical protein
LKTNSKSSEDNALKSVPALPGNDQLHMRCNPHYPFIFTGDLNERFFAPRLLSLMSCKSGHCKAMHSTTGLIKSISPVKFRKAGQYCTKVASHIRFVSPVNF